MTRAIRNGFEEVLTHPLSWQCVIINEPKKMLCYRGILTVTRNRRKWLRLLIGQYQCNPKDWAASQRSKYKVEVAKAVLGCNPCNKCPYARRALFNVPYAICTIQKLLSYSRGEAILIEGKSNIPELPMASGNDEEGTTHGSYMNPESPSRALGFYLGHKYHPTRLRVS
jgi:hypothetical protein